MTGKNRLPRLDLHCHLDGSLSQGCIEELLGRSVKLEELQADMDCQSLAEYLEKFEIPLECLQTEKGLERAGYDLMKSAASDQVDYIEARFAPLFSGQRGLSTEQVIESVLRGMEQGKKEFDIDYGVIVCAMRHEKEEANLQMLKAAREFLGNGVCAADLAGNEAAFPMSQFMNLFAEVKRMEMPFTLHAGAVCRIFWMQCSAVLPEWAMELRFAGRKKQSGSAETDTLESRCVRSAICRQKR